MTKHTVSRVEDMIATEDDAEVSAMLREYATLLTEKEAAAKAAYGRGFDKWVGLTDEEIKAIIGHNHPGGIGSYARELFKQIEAKLREKNT